MKPKIPECGRRRQGQKAQAQFEPGGHAAAGAGHPARNFEEVALGYTYEMAMEETSRCIKCKKRNCQQGCPVNIDIPDFIAALAKDDVAGASRILKSQDLASRHLWARVPAGSPV